MVNRTQARKADRLSWVGILASPYLSLVVVGVLMLLALVGALVPQHGVVEELDIQAWRLQHPTATPILEKTGCFAIFVSPVFLASLGVLFINTLACTLHSIIQKKLFAEKDLHTRLRRVGFIALHISILVCIAGGFISAGFRMTGSMVLTEGQTLTDNPASYTKLTKGPFWNQKRGSFRVELLDAEFTPAKEWDYGSKKADLAFSSDQHSRVTAHIEFNQPFSFAGTVFTIQEIGYSPRITLSSLNPRIPPFNGFVSLKTWGFNNNREHRDFLALPRSNDRLVLTLYPSHDVRDGTVKRRSEELDNPVLMAHLEYADGTKSPEQSVLPGETAAVGELRVRFGELRQWASFLVVEDPGYRIVCLAFWMAVVALMLRYAPDILEWVKEAQSDGTD